MAYELNLTAAQYEAVYEINLDYLMSLNGHGDVFGIWWDRRNSDLRYVLNSWQYDKYVALSHFYADRKVTKPVVHHAPAPAPHHPKAPVEVDKRRGITNHTLASNKPRHGHSRSTSGRLLP